MKVQSIVEEQYICIVRCEGIVTFEIMNGYCLSIIIVNDQYESYSRYIEYFVSMQCLLP